MQLRRRGALVAATAAVLVSTVAPAGTASASTDPVQCVKDGAATLAHWLIDGRPIEPVAC